MNTNTNRPTNLKLNDNYINSNSMISKSLSKFDYNFILYSNLSKETVAEELFNIVNNSKPVDEVNKLPLNERINYIFSKSEVITLAHLLKICGFKLRTNLNNNISNSNNNYLTENHVLKANHNVLKSILKYTAYRAIFATEKIIILKMN